ncbi:Tripartite tricarboxylate transporter family receptor [compost metagenome]|uniref:Bug family tripartite tricarboxylate transporter substrate binding protein n=1 Tax=Achromobacter sp. Root83 TaxID=1736602 RepID=UPI00070B049C|nr:tripartite tricarboxylate transporter substrate binding protein [Achromobacter sp. Root83]KRC84801.1 ABC transporter substrate-binding protein [Achromobacter sp. Root83]
MSSEPQHPLQDARRRRMLGALGAAGLCALAPWERALAQSGPWPQRPINYVVPFPPGGLTDVAARQVAKALGDAERWNVVVENKPGGSANIGAAHVSHAAPDGYTWLAITLSHAANATLFAGKAGYDLTRDLTPLAGLASSPIMVVVNAKSSIKSMDDLARAARAKPLAAGSSGNGTPPHLTLALYQKLTGTPLTHVPYKGGAPSLTDLIGGHLDVVFSNYPESLAHVKNGSLRALAITTRDRSADLPDVPTVAQVGLPDLIVENFTGVLAPAGTPPELVRSIGAAIVKQVSQPAMKQALLQLGFVPQARGPEEFGAYLKSEVDRWAKIIRDANIQVA